MEEILVELMAKYPIASYVVLSIAALVVIAQTIVSLTPTKSDDEFMKKLEGIPFVGSLLKVLVKLAPFKKKE